MAVCRFSFLALLLALIWHRAASQTCNADRCQDCIRLADCVWCATPTSSSFNVTNSDRCTLMSGVRAGCDSMDIQDPQGTEDPTQTNRDENIPVNPSTTYLDLRVGQTRSFQVNVTFLPNLPLDLYILMDLSGSMQTDLENVRSISRDIVGSISEITTNVLLGFGSFVDKPVRPYSFIPPGTPCMPNTCPIYSFRHVVRLTPDQDVFAAALDAASTTTLNVDNPESGLEGLAQVVACTNIIGWRENSTRVVLFITDDAFHFSGEGRFATILRPYEGQCLLDEPADINDPVDHTQWDVFDYPSVGQIVSLLQEEEIVPIIAAVISNTSLRLGETYRELARLVNVRFGTERAVAAEIERGTSSQPFLDLIENEVFRLFQEARLFAVPSNVVDVSFQFSATCPINATIETDPTTGDTFCNQVPVESTSIFTVSITLNSCYNQSSPIPNQLLDFPVPVTVRDPTFGEFTVMVTGNCNCPCENDTVTGDFSSICVNGVFECGVCVCDPGWCGPICNISIDVAAMCPVDDLGILCANRGDCVCTMCECRDPDPADVPPGITDPVIFGDACQCDNFRCNSAEQNQCNDRGMCCNGMCLCNRNERGFLYRGPGCECNPEEEVCRNVTDTDGEICFGRGSCGCTSCDCDQGFRGQFCDCLDGACVDSNEDCINTPIPAPGNCQQCGNARSIICRVSDTFARTFTGSSPTFEQIEDEAREVIGSSFDLIESDCDIENNDYFLLCNATNFLLLVFIPVPASSDEILGNFPPWALAIIILIVLLILGILALAILKIIFIILDYIEVKRWEKEAKEADFSKNQNPLYQSPEMKYENPAHGRPL